MSLLPQREASSGRALALALAFTVFAALAPACPAAAGDEQAAQTYCSMQGADCAAVCQPGGAAATYAASAPYPGADLAAQGARGLPVPKSAAGVPRGVLLAGGPPPYLLHRRLLL